MRKPFDVASPPGLILAGLILAGLTAAGALLSAAPARAADPLAVPAATADELPPVEPLPPPDADLVGTGLYLRGSAGYGFAADLDAAERRRGFARSRIDTAAAISGGVGLKLNAFFRTDITLDHRFASDLDGRVDCPAPCGAGAPQRRRERGDLAASTAMVNGYFDISEFGPVVPYLGAGLGASYLSLDDRRFRTDAGTRGPIGDADAWNAAYALMAGIAFDVSDNMVVDVGYRFAAFGDLDAPGPRGTGRRGDVDLDGLRAQEVTVGLRYVFK